MQESLTNAGITEKDYADIMITVGTLMIHQQVEFQKLSQIFNHNRNCLQTTFRF